MFLFVVTSPLLFLIFWKYFVKLVWSSKYVLAFDNVKSLLCSSVLAALKGPSLYWSTKIHHPCSTLLHRFTHLQIWTWTLKLTNIKLTASQRMNFLTFSNSFSIFHISLPSQMTLNLIPQSSHHKNRWVVSLSERLSEPHRQNC